ncbi:MAG: universal stress protein [Flammeovirgaceae bacterium]|nr:universal stress protein [Flammeovirgaceae bacterium]
MPALKILLLTDFSNLSKVAIDFGLKMAEQLDAEITILHGVRIDGVPKSNLRWKRIEKEVIKIAQEEGDKLLKSLKGKSKRPLKFVAAPVHTMADAVTKYTHKNLTNLVIMGSQGASNLKMARMGGTTVSVIDKSLSPVLAIPESATFKGFKHAVYASDLKNIQKELDTILPFAKIFDSHVHMVHVAKQKDAELEKAKAAAIEKVAKMRYPKIDFQILVDDDIPLAIDQYIKDTKSEVLITFTHELNLFEKLFSLSVTRKLAYRARTPLFAFKRRK